MLVRAPSFVCDSVSTGARVDKHNFDVTILQKAGNSYADNTVRQKG